MTTAATLNHAGWAKCAILYAPASVSNTPAITAGTAVVLPAMSEEATPPPNEQTAYTTSSNTNAADGIISVPPATYEVFTNVSHNAISIIAPIAPATTGSTIFDAVMLAITVKLTTI